MTREEALNKARIRYLPLPDDIRGMAKWSSGGYLVVINSNLSADEQAKTIEHELNHIRLNHFDSDADIMTLEAEADNILA